ncbi:hypothetical protein TGDOM2_361080 [Toxoplasma gondii GAB2-2007-GAL-DOM2]|uniref:Uncharacterized protein n=2 Tax=Toxoplasma gondii TaxID=5811 RepID=A0A086LCN9_TOXGO|nr:hypothetical protein TGDOM2_361080 [Toxoplasma gondii GAB2-2007-GAL-DOM2]KFG54407.1 hypothetical protein TGFOU_361080 [Toxoplasma gondii FOU]
MSFSDQRVVDSYLLHHHQHSHLHLSRLLFPLRPFLSLFPSTSITFDGHLHLYKYTSTTYVYISVSPSIHVRRSPFPQPFLHRLRPLSSHCYAVSFLISFFGCLSLQCVSAACLSADCCSPSTSPS